MYTCVHVQLKKSRTFYSQKRGSRRGKMQFLLVKLIKKKIASLRVQRRNKNVKNSCVAHNLNSSQHNSCFRVSRKFDLNENVSIFLPGVFLCKYDMCLIRK